VSGRVPRRHNGAFPGEAQALDLPLEEALSIAFTRCSRRPVRAAATGSA
jgi:hypothetical protein